MRNPDYGLLGPDVDRLIASGLQVLGLSILAGFWEMHPSLLSQITNPDFRIRRAFPMSASPYQSPNAAAQGAA